MATTDSGTPFKLATVQAETDARRLKAELESALRSTDAVIVLEEEVVAVMAGSPKEVQAGTARVASVLKDNRLSVKIRVEREPFRKRLQDTAHRVIRGEVPVHRRSQGVGKLPSSELRRLYQEMRKQAWDAQLRVTTLETELRKTRMELKIQRLTNEQLMRESSSRKKRKLWKT